ncbi:hypothetical protein KM043_016855 [Ampulex compressa]|nr:hypothetical protein KM043_016855 [Ampulex compressa]
MPILESPPSSTGGYFAVESRRLRKKIEARGASNLDHAISPDFRFPKSADQSVTEFSLRNKDCVGVSSNNSAEGSQSICLSTLRSANAFFQGSITRVLGCGSRRKRNRSSEPGGGNRLARLWTVL